MTQIDLISNEWSDLLFENRNKEYGAYVLRHQTGTRNIISIIAVLIIFALAMAFMVAKNAIDDYRAKNVAHTQVTEFTTWNEKKPEIKVERAEPVRQEDIEKVVKELVSSIKFTAPVIKKDDEVNPEDEMKTQEELMKSKVAIAAFDVFSDSETGEVLRAKEALITETVKPKEEETKIFTVVEQMPSFPGGPSALMQYLSKNIKYPPFAEENGIQGRVVCTFVVERDGSVTDIHIAKGVDSSLDKEAIRVVSAMPKWIPGRQNGQMVRVKYTLPVTFRLQ